MTEIDEPEVLTAVTRVTNESLLNREPPTFAELLAASREVLAPEAWWACGRCGYQWRCDGSVPRCSQCGAGPAPLEVVDGGETDAE